MHVQTFLSAALLVGFVSAAETSNTLPTNSNISAADALLSQNAEWSRYVNNFDRPLLAKNSQGQSPKVLWLGCADSRVPESVLTQSMPGEVFVARNIANQFNLQDDSIVSVLTYAVQALGVEHGERTCE
jgi:carbonic anhydrase